MHTHTRSPKAKDRWMPLNIAIIVDCPVSALSFTLSLSYSHSIFGITKCSIRPTCFASISRSRSLKEPNKINDFSWNVICSVSSIPIFFYNNLFIELIASKRHSNTFSTHNFTFTVLVKRRTVIFSSKRHITLRAQSNNNNNKIIDREWDSLFCKNCSRNIRTIQFHALH